MRPPVSVVVPCYNEQAGLPALFARLDALLRDGGRGWRVLFVDDGSGDATFACLLSEVGRRPWARVVRHPTNLGLGRAVSGLYQRLVGQDVHTFTCLFRAYRRDALVRIPFRSDGFASVAEIMLRALLAGYRVRELPMRFGARRFGESKLKIGDAIVAHASLLMLAATLVATRRLRALVPGV